MGDSHIGAVVVGAGQSRRMGRPKLMLPWGDITVIEAVVRSVKQGGADEIVVVTGETHDEVSALLAGAARTVKNQNYATGEMISSVKVGLNSLSNSAEAALVVLGDQPQIETGVVRQIIESYYRSQAGLVIPSYEMKRGHPWLIQRDLWQDVLSLAPGSTLRTFVNTHSEQIEYVSVNTPSVLADIDTPSDYLAYRPG